MKTAIHVCNRSPHMSFWSGKPASYDHLHIFGYDAFLHLRPELRSKLDAKSMKGMLMGYGDEGEMGNRIWLPQLKKVIHS